MKWISSLITANLLLGILTVHAMEKPTVESILLTITRTHEHPDNTPITNAPANTEEEKRTASQERLAAVQRWHAMRELLYASHEMRGHLPASHEPIRPPAPVRLSPQTATITAIPAALDGAVNRTATLHFVNDDDDDEIFEHAEKI